MHYINILTTAQAIEMSVTVNSRLPKDYTHQDSDIPLP